MKILYPLLMALGVASATLGVDYPDKLAVSDLQCLRSHGVQFVIPRAWHSYGAFDVTSINNINNARKAGVQTVDVYLFPCRKA